MIVANTRSGQPKKKLYPVLYQVELSNKPIEKSTHLITYLMKETRIIDIYGSNIRLMSTMEI